MLGQLRRDRLARLRRVMVERDVAAILTADPINIAYAVGARNMTVFGMMGATRFVLVFADGPAVLWEFAGCEHLANGLETVDEVRIAPGITATAGGYVTAIADFADEIDALCRRHAGGDRRLAVERFDHPVTDAFRAVGLDLSSATDVLSAARSIKAPSEIDAMRIAVRRVEAGLASMSERIEPGRSEVDVWSEFHRHLIAHEGEYVVTRLAQAGHRTYPYFQEAGSSVLAPGDLFCIDTDAIGYAGCAVDLSRTYVCGDAAPSSGQRDLHALALEQLRHNAALLGAGRSFESFARSAWVVPDRLAGYRYYCLAHGLGTSGEWPNLPPSVEGQPYPLQGEFQASMVICIESYLGDAHLGEGVKLEDQYLITDTGVERLTTSPFDPALADR